MAAADVSSLLEVASTPDLATTTPPEPILDEAVVESPEGVSEGTEAGAKPDKTAADKVDFRTNPDAIRKELRAMRDSDPAKADLAKHLNYLVGHEKAYADIFPKVADAKEAKFLIESVGGKDGLTNLQNTIKAVNETDQLLYNGDGRVVKNLYEDMKAAGHPEALGKLAGPYLDQLKEVDSKVYQGAIMPHLIETLEGAGFAESLKLIEQALADPAKPNVEALQQIVKGMKGWFLEHKEAIGQQKKSAIDPDRQAFEKEREDFRSQQTKAFQADVNTGWNDINNRILGAALKPYLSLPFAKNWTDATKLSVAREIMQTLLSELSGDKAYQSQMDAFWSESKPDKAKILNFHKSKVDIIAAPLVKNVLDARYPGFSSVKGAPVADKKPAPTTQVQPQTGKPIYQTTKPNVMDSKIDATIDWAKDPHKHLWISGRFYTKDGKFRTWNPKFK